MAWDYLQVQLSKSTKVGENVKHKKMGLEHQK